MPAVDEGEVGLHHFARHEIVVEQNLFPLVRDQGDVREVPNPNPLGSMKSLASEG